MTDEQHPEPPVSPDVDLRDFPYSPIFRVKFFCSSFYALATDEDWRVGITLWLNSWGQVPAESLPDDGIDICHIAELGCDMNMWKKLRAGIMCGWSLCSDARLFHPVVAEDVNEVLHLNLDCEVHRKMWRGRKKAQMGDENLSATLAKTDGVSSHCGIVLTTTDHTLSTHFHVDHLHPLVRGGSHEFENLVPSCKRGNLKKGSKLNFKARNGGVA